MSVRDMLMAAAGVDTGGGSDDNFKNVTLLLNGDGTNGAQNNTFVDSSSNNFTITRNGNTTQGSFSPYGSLWSNYFNGSSYLTSSTTTISNFGTGAFTFECWVFKTNNNDAFIYDGRTAGNSYSFGLRINGSNYVQPSTNGSALFTSSSTIPLNQWVHIAYCRTSTSSNQTALFINGVRDTLTTDSTNYVQYSNTIGATSYNVGDIPLTGYISNMRIVKGSDVYGYSNSTITVPTTPLTAITNTTLLICQSNRFIDSSSTNATFSVGGTPSVQRFSPFNPTASYDTATIGGSGYFDGSGDYLTVANNAAFDFGSGDFTIEMWYYPTTAQDTSLITKRASNSNYPPFQLQTTSSKQFILYASTTGSSFAVSVTTSATFTLNAWNHIAIVRNGTGSNNYVLYLNGVSVATGSLGSTALFTNTSGVAICADATDGSLASISGYVSDVKLVKGTAVYTSAFTPPTAPLTATSGTSLLCNMTNAGIPDSAMMNDLETVGNAQVSTSVKKFGTGSIAFDGSGDILQFPASQYWNFSSGDWTIEGWLYPNTISGGQILLENTTDGTGGLSIQMNGSAFLVYINSTAINAGTFTASTWQHFALVRSGSTMTAYINGSSVGTSSTTPGSGATGLWIGSRSGGSISLNGYIDDLRITKGYARYTANFTPPTAALPVK